MFLSTLLKKVHYLFLFSSSSWQEKKKKEKPVKQMILKGCQAVPQNSLIDKLDLHFLSQTEKTDIILKKKFPKTKVETCTIFLKYIDILRWIFPIKRYDKPWSSVM